MANQNSSGLVRVNGNALYYEDYGRGTPIVFVHGAFNTSDMWRPILNEARQLAGRIPGASLEVIEGSQHGPNLENPASFNAAIRRLVAATETAESLAA